MITVRRFSILSVQFGFLVQEYPLKLKFFSSVFQVGDLGGRLATKDRVSRAFGGGLLEEDARPNGVLVLANKSLTANRHQRTCRGDVKERDLDPEKKLFQSHTDVLMLRGDFLAAVIS